MNKEICIRLRADEPIRFGESVAITIEVTVKKDIPDLQVSLTSYPPVLIEDGQVWKERAVS